MILLVQLLSGSLPVCTALLELCEDTQLPSIGQFHVGFAESYTKLSTLNCQDSWSKVYSFATNPTRICTVSFSNLAPIQADPTPDCPLLEVWSDNFARSYPQTNETVQFRTNPTTVPTVHLQFTDANPTPIPTI